ncbi:TPA: hypothetical protein RQK06_002295 [Vibrio vulnificus]|jgi:hypothetical protein|uniref:hypothetical protein n=1 Tax=Vibrio rotiferianus TaxID=190895 RepID=UPI0011102E03|nr:hypothetical protein [Vibrio rotiferianus]TMX64576.1 hypothetical protein DA097_12685 [Vibrio rotiferianus]HDY7702277.1 hypothetical protein [Vibrio vulnificus]
MFIDFLEMLKDAMLNGDYKLFLLIVSVGIIFNLNTIHRYLDARKKSRIELLKECKENTVESRLREHYDDELQMEYFRLAHKHKATPLEIKLMLDVVDSSDNRLKLFHFFRADQFISYSRSELVKVEIPFFSAIYAYCVLAFSCLLMFAVLYGAIPNLTLDKVKVDMMGTIVLAVRSIFIIIISLFASTLSWPYYSAKQVKNELERQMNSKKSACSPD